LGAMTVQTRFLDDWRDVLAVGQARFFGRRRQFAGISQVSTEANQAQAESDTYGEQTMGQVHVK
jgi:hypothetical protein